MTILMRKIGVEKKKEERKNQDTISVLTFSEFK